MNCMGCDVGVQLQLPLWQGHADACIALHDVALDARVGWVFCVDSCNAQGW
jgi:hypothetical protein